MSITAIRSGHTTDQDCSFLEHQSI